MKHRDTPEEIIRKNLIAFREEADLSQGALADLAGIPVTNYGRYERGENSTPATILKALADVLGRSTDDFHMENPPALRNDPPTFFLRTRPGVTVDDATYRHLLNEVSKANAVLRDKKPKR